MSIKSSGHTLDLELKAPVKCQNALGISELYKLAAEAIDEAPSYPRLREWGTTIQNLEVSCRTIREAAAVLKQAIDAMMKEEPRHLKAWKEYDRYLCPSSAQYIKPYCSEHCNPQTNKEVNSTTCPIEEGKPCPFCDWPCAERLGDSCDHLAAGLSIASELWLTAANAEQEHERHRARARCNQFAAEHLLPWVSPVTNALFEKVSSKFYISLTVLIDALTNSESPLPM